MNKMQIFNNPEFGKLRMVDMDGQPWLVGRDVAEALGYSNPRKALADHVDEEDKTDGVTIRDSIGRDQNPTIINESGLYSLVLSSKLPGASWNMPTQRSMDMGLFEIKETAITHSDGSVTVSKTVKVTGDGQNFFVNKFLKDKQKGAPTWQGPQ